MSTPRNPNATPTLSHPDKYWELSIEVTEHGRLMRIEYTRADRACYRARIADNGDLLHPCLSNVPAHVRTAAKRKARSYLKTLETS